VGELVWAVLIHGTWPSCSSYIWIGNIIIVVSPRICSLHGSWHVAAEHLPAAASTGASQTSQLCRFASQQQEGDKQHLHSQTQHLNRLLARSSLNNPAAAAGSTLE
jgi:hypothetical protein